MFEVILAYISQLSEFIQGFLTIVFGFANLGKGDNNGNTTEKK